MENKTAAFANGSLKEQDGASLMSGAQWIRGVLQVNEAYSWGVGEYEFEDGRDGFREGV